MGAALRSLLSKPQKASVTAASTPWQAEGFSQTQIAQAIEATQALGHPMLRPSNTSSVFSPLGAATESRVMVLVCGASCVSQVGCLGACSFAAGLQFELCAFGGGAVHSILHGVLFATCVSYGVVQVIEWIFGM